MVASWEGCVGEMGKDVRVLRSTNRYLQNIHGNINYSAGHGVAKEPMYDPQT